MAAEKAAEVIETCKLGTFARKCWLLPPPTHNRTTPLAAPTSRHRILSQPPSPWLGVVCSRTPQTPVVAEEELQAPPALKKPSRDAIKEKEDKIKADQAEIDVKFKKVSDKIKALQGGEKKDDGTAETRSKLKALKVKREGLIAERTALYAARDAARESRDAKMSEMKDLKSQTKYKDVGEIDRKIKALETQQATTSMTLAKEKEILKEVSELKNQRRLVAQAMAVAGALDGGKASSADHGATIKSISEQLATIKAEEDKLKGTLAKVEKKDDAYPALVKEKDALRAARKVKSDEMQALWDDFRDANEAWRKNQEAWDKYKKVKDAAWRAEREAKAAKWAAERAEELAKKTPYEEEMGLCEYLVNYLTTTFLKEEQAAEAKPEVALSGEFAGMALTSSKKDGGDFYLKPTGLKGPKKKGGAKGGPGGKKGKIVLFPETLESFGLLGMTPPATTDAVAACVEALNAKKAAFAVMPRGQVLSIAEMNAKLELEPMTRPRGDKAAAPKEKKGGKVDVASTELFPTLGGSKPAAEKK